MTNEPPAAARGAVRLWQLFPLVVLWNSGYKGTRVVNTLFALNLGATPFEIGLLLATYGLFALVLALYAGRFIDRYGVRVPVTGGLVASAGGILLPFFWPTLTAIFVSAALTGAAFIFVQVGLQTLMGSLASGPARTRNINLYSLVIASADFLGPVVAGFAIDHVGYAPAYLVLALVTASALIVLAFVSKTLPPGAGDIAERARRRAIDLLRVRDLQRIFIASAVVMTGLDIFQLYMPLYGHAIGLSASAIGLVLGAFAVAAFVTRAIMPLIVQKLGEERSLTWSLLCAAATFVLIPFVQNGLWLGIISFVLGVGMALGQPLSVVLAYNYSPAGRAGETVGLRIAINNTMHVVIPTLFGGLGSLVGIGPVFWLSSAVLGLGAYVSRRRGA